MYKPMRREDRATDATEAMEILKKADFGFLGLATKDGLPYVVPLNHVVVDGHIVFHCAKDGQKLDFIRQNPRVCYSVCPEHKVIPEEATTKYSSATAFGTAEIVENFETKKSLLVALMAGLAPGVPFKCDDQSVTDTCVVRIKVENVTGKRRD